MHRILIVLAIIFTPSCYANAGVIGVFGFSSSNVTTFLNANGHSATDFGTSVNAANLSGLDAAILMRYPGNADLVNFVQNGGLLITEWSAADWAANTAGFFGSSISGGGFVGTGTPVTITPAGVAIGLDTGLSNPYSDSGSTEFFRNVVSPGTGTVFACRPGDEVVFGGEVGSGYVFINTSDWGDEFYGGLPPGAAANSGQFLLNMLSVQAAQVPEPASIAIWSALGVPGLFGTRRRRKAQA